MASRLSAKLSPQTPRERNHLRAAHKAPASPRSPPAMRPTQHVRSELWAQLKRDAASRPDVDPGALLMHYCRFRALCVLAGVPLSTPAARAALPTEAVGAAFDALAFQHAAFRETVVRALEGPRRGRVDWAAYVRAVLALGTPGSNLAFTAACRQTESAEAVSAAELHELLCDSLDFAGNSSRSEVALVADRIVAKLFAESGLAPGAKICLRELDELDVWGMFNGASLVELTAALQRERLEELVVQGSAARSLPIRRATGR